MQPQNNEEYLKHAFQQLEKGGVQTPESIKRTNAEFVKARETLRNAMGSSYDKRIGEYKQMLQELMHRDKVSALMAAQHCIASLQKPENKETDPLGMAQMMFMAAALDILEPQIRNN